MAMLEKGTSPVSSVLRRGNQDTVCPELHGPSFALASSPWLNPNGDPAKICPQLRGWRNVSCTSRIWTLLCSTGFLHSWTRPGMTSRQSRHHQSARIRAEPCSSRGKLRAAGWGLELQPDTCLREHTRVSGLHFGPPPPPPLPL